MSTNKVFPGAVRRDLDRFRRALDAFCDGDRGHGNGQQVAPVWREGDVS